MKRAICMMQCVYFLATELCPLIHVMSFQAVTGRKTDNWTAVESDHWLLNTVSVLILAIGLTLLTAAARAHIPIEIAVLAVASAVGLIAIDVIYVSRSVIFPVYLIDAALEIILVLLWIVAMA